MAIYDAQVASAAKQQKLEQDKFESSTDPGQIFLSSLSSEMPRQVLGALGNMAVDAVRWELLGGKKTDEENRIMEVYENNPGLRAGIATKYPNLFNVGFPAQSSSPAPAPVTGRPAIPSMPKPKAQVPTAPVAPKIIDFGDGSVGVPEKTYTEFQNHLKGQSDGSDQGGVDDLVDALNKAYNPGVSFGDKEKLAKRYTGSPSGDGESTSPEKTLADFGPRFGDKEAKPTMIKMGDGSMIRRISPDEGRQFKKYFNEKKKATAALQAAAPPVESSPPPVAAAPVERPAPRGIDRRSSAEIEAANTLEQKNFTEAMKRSQTSISDVLGTIAADPNNERSKRAAESLINTVEAFPPKFHKQAITEIALLVNTLPDDQAQAVWNQLVLGGGSVKSTSGARAGIINVLKNLRSTTDGMQGLTAVLEEANDTAVRLSGKENLTPAEKGELKRAKKVVDETVVKLADLNAVEGSEYVATEMKVLYNGEEVVVAHVPFGQRKTLFGGTSQRRLDKTQYAQELGKPSSLSERTRLRKEILGDVNVSDANKAILLNANNTPESRAKAMSILVEYGYANQKSGGGAKEKGESKDRKARTKQTLLASHLKKDVLRKLIEHLGLSGTATMGQIAKKLGLSETQFKTYLSNGLVPNVNTDKLTKALNIVYPNLAGEDVVFAGYDKARTHNPWITRRKWNAMSPADKANVQTRARSDIKQTYEKH